MLEIDAMTAEELRAADAVTQIGALNDLFGEINVLASEKRARIDDLADAKIRALKDPSSEAKAIVVDARRKVDKVSVSISARREQIRILQTLLRSIPA